MRLSLCALALSWAATLAAEEPKQGDEAAEKAARVRIKFLMLAVQTSYVQNGKWPKILDEVAPLLEDGKKALGDPWGKQYQYAVVKGKPYVWTERTVDKETKVYGEKPPEEKKAAEKK